MELLVRSGSEGPSYKRARQYGASSTMGVKSDMLKRKVVFHPASRWRASLSRISRCASSSPRLVLLLRGRFPRARPLVGQLGLLSEGHFGYTSTATTILPTLRSTSPLAASSPRLGASVVFPMAASSTFYATAPSASLTQTKSPNSPGPRSPTQVMRSTSPMGHFGAGESEMEEGGGCLLALA